MISFTGQNRSLQATALGGVANTHLQDRWLLPFSMAMVRGPRYQTSNTRQECRSRRSERIGAKKEGFRDGLAVLP